MSAQCKLTECLGRPRCKTCLAMDAAYTPAPAVGLRDLFAGLAMLGEIITSTSDATPESSQALLEAAERGRRDPVDQVALNAYRWADAMLKARLA